MDSAFHSTGPHAVPYNLSVSMLRSAIPLLAAIPAFLALQTMSCPLMFCLPGSCEMVQSKPFDSEGEHPCTAAEPAEAEAAGCCEEPVEVVMACGGCRDMDKPVRVANCLPDRTSSKPCGTPDKDGKDRDHTCPLPSPACGPCIPLHLYVVPAGKDLARLADDNSIALSFEATRALAEGDHRRGFLHSHSPPVLAVARSGPQICIEKCSFLL